MADNNYFDVFICHNSEDKNQVRAISNQLKNLGLAPWFDEWALPPGQRWQPKLHEQIQIIRSAAVFIGNSGLGPWQEMEIDIFLQEFVKRKYPIIPVILKTALVIPDIPPFLKSFTWVDFRIEEPDPIQRLIWGITAENNTKRSTDPIVNDVHASFLDLLRAENLNSLPYLQQWSPHDIGREIELIKKAYKEFSSSSLKDSDIIEYLKKSEAFVHRIRLSHYIDNLTLRNELYARLSLVDEWFLSLIDDSENRYKLRSLRIDFIRQKMFNN